MFGFGKKKNDETGAPATGEEDRELQGVAFHIMPEVQGGAVLASPKDDDIKKEEKKKAAIKKEEPRPTLAPPSAPVATPTMVPPPLLVGAPPLPHGAEKIVLAPIAGKSHRLLFILLILFVILAAGGGGWDWYRTQTNASTVDRDKASVSETPVATASAPEESVGIASPIETPVPSNGVHFLAGRGLISTSDLDADLLTDAEEALFGTDPGIPDTDHDGWPDGWEIVQLYDPALPDAARVTNSVNMIAFANQEYGYAFLYPGTWVVQAVDGQDAREVIATSATGEFIQVTAVPISATDVGIDEPGELLAWVNAEYPGGSNFPLQSFTNEFNAEVVQTADALTSFVQGNGMVYVIRYMPGLREEINFKRTMAMMVAGFLIEEGTPPALLREPTPIETIEPRAASTPQESGIATSTEMAETEAASGTIL